MSSFCFAAVEPLRTASFSVERNGGAGETIDRVIPSPAEEPALLTKMKENQFASVRTGFQRILNPCGSGGTWSVSSSFCRSSFGAGSNVNFINVKNSILLKLRI
jgi:hypothetical protein